MYQMQILIVMLIMILFGLASVCKATDDNMLAHQYPRQVVTRHYGHDIAKISLMPSVYSSKINNEANSLTDTNNTPSKQCIYFDSDAYIIKKKYASLISANALYLLGHPHAHVILQGNTDERGTREFNLSAGLLRAFAIKKALLQLGVPNEQIETVSLGEENPLSFDHNEAAWKQNRRTEIIYQTEQ
jgi:peptidoglycan-associated lipoprotein